MNKKKQTKKMPKTKEIIPEKSLGEKILEVPYWYHKIELPDENITPGWAPINADKYGIPDDLTGKRILDIGTWDGYWTWEALKRGAKEVVAIDDFSDDLGLQVKRNKWETFDLCREALGYIDLFYDESISETGYLNKTGQKIFRLELSVYDIEQLGHFDIVFFFGTIYHLKYPLYALEKISAICDGEIYIESAICDDYSPYRQAIGSGYPHNDVVMEFYPGKQYGNNESNWWVPTIQCLGTMVESVGFKNIHGWALTDKPTGVPECRGFVYGSKTGAENINVTNLAVTAEAKKAHKLSVAAVMSVPRLGFQDNSFCVLEGLVPLRIPVFKSSGAYWGQCLERGIQDQIDNGYDAILTLDYDTIFTRKDVETLIRLMLENPEVDAIVPMQSGRANMGALLTLKTKTGKVRDIVQHAEFEPDITKIATGHFGLTLFRASSLLKVPHPWLIAKPDLDGQWGPGKIDADIYFWKHIEKVGLNVYSANRVVLGHLELVIKWLDEKMKSVFQTTKDFQDYGKPKNVWK